LASRRVKKPAKSPAQKISEGLQAQRELERTSEAFDTVRDGLLEAFANTKLGEVDARERIYLSLQVLESVKAALVAVAANAPVEQHEIAMQRIMNG